MNFLKINGLTLSEEQMRDRERVLSIPGCDEPFADFLLEWWNEAPFVVAHTSGSTGEPKRIELSKQSMRESARRTNRYFGLQEGKSILMCLSANYIAGKMMVVRALVGGLDLYVQSASSLPKLERPYDLVSMVPLQVHSLMERGMGESAMANVRNLLVGGSPLMREESEWLLALPQTKSYISYGMTETVSHVALSLLPKGGMPLYEALPDVTFSKDERDCLVIHAPYLVGSPFVTNDVVELLSDHSFHWLGRWDHVINTGGVKVFPEKMEKKIESIVSHPFYFIGVKDAKFGERVVLKIESEPFDTTLLRQEMACLLAPYEMPREIVFLPQFQRLANGKLKRI